MIESEREKKLSSMTWPKESMRMCLHCGIAKPRRHSWFCRVECEDAYVKENNE